MTKLELVTELSERLSLYSPEALERLDRAVDRAHRRVTSETGLIVSRRVTVSQAKSLGSASVTFSGIEKIERVIDDTSGDNVVLAEVTFDQLRRQTPGATTPTSYAIENMDANSVTIRLDVLAQDTDVLKADGHTTVADLADGDSPAFPESFHEIILEAVMMDELRKKDDVAGAKIARAEYDRILSNLKYWIAKSGYLRQRQGERVTGNALSGGAQSSGSGTSGGTSYTQTGLIAFDRDPDVPFAVASGSAVVPNLDADKVDGKHYSDITDYVDAAVLTAVQGPASATDSAISRFDGITGKVLQNSGITIADGATGTLSGSNSGDVSLVTTAANYISIAGQALTLGLINLASHVAGRLPFANLVAATAASKLLGRGSASGSGDVQELSVGSGVTISGTTVQADPANFPSAVPVAKGGTGVSTANANAVFSGPTSGAAAAPSFRSLVTADLPAGLARVIDAKVTETTVVNSAVQTTVYSFSVPANTLGSTHALRLTLYGSLVNNTGSTQNLTYAGLFGATTIFTTTIGASASASPRSFQVQALIYALNATNAQRAHTSLVVSSAGSGSGGLQLNDSMVTGCHDSVAEDSTSALTLAVKVTLPTASANLSFVCRSARLELLVTP